MTVSVSQSILCALFNFSVLILSVIASSSTSSFRLDDCDTMKPDSSMERFSFEAHERLLLNDEHDIADINTSSGREFSGSEVKLEGKKGIWYLIALIAGLGG